MGRLFQMLLRKADLFNTDSVKDHLLLSKLYSLGKNWEGTRFNVVKNDKISRHADFKRSQRRPMGDIKQTVKYIDPCLEILD